MTSLAALVVGVAVGWIVREAEVRSLRQMAEVLRADAYSRMDHQVRMERVDRGLSEVGKTPRDPDPMPADVFHMTRLFPSGGSGLRAAAMRLRQDGAGWDAIRQYLREEIERQSPGLLDKLVERP